MSKKYKVPSVRQMPKKRPSKTALISKLCKDSLKALECGELTKVSTRVEPQIERQSLLIAKIKGQIQNLS